MLVDELNHNLNHDLLPLKEKAYECRRITAISRQPVKGGGPSQNEHHRHSTIPVLALPIRHGV
ncbi:hypothetical protein EV13_0878 [Prochlorococcus sp. MIT 0702]|nr:hypothetical protein EV13_0878 [Prochlorococcus sp. MIT 0702]